MPVIYKGPRIYKTYYIKTSRKQYKIIQAWLKCRVSIEGNIKVTVKNKKLKIKTVSRHGQWC
jgi:hypothetical protein